ncbi:MAG: hypothetical protein ACKPJJ_20690, partial [Planctomycetaceae bacterium]
MSPPILPRVPHHLQIPQHLCLFQGIEVQFDHQDRDIEVSRQYPAWTPVATVDNFFCPSQGVGILRGEMTAGGLTAQCPTTPSAVSEICLARWNGCFFWYLRLCCRAG